MVTTETINLKDNVSGPAKSAADSVTALSQEMTSLTKALTTAQNKMAVASATGNIKAYRSAQNDVMNLKAAISLLPPQAEHTAAAATKAAEATQHMSAAQHDAAASSAEMQSELAGVTGGLSIAVEAIGAVVLAFGALTIAGAKFAIEASQAKAQMISMFDALGEGAVKGEQIDDMLDNMRTKLGVTKDSMVPLVKEWMSMGVTSEDAIERMTTAALSAKALTGGSQAAADAFTKLSKKIQLAAETGQSLKIPLKGLGSLASMGLTVDDVAKKMGVSAKDLAAHLKSGSVDAAKFGDALQGALIDKGAGPLQTMSLSVENLGAMFKEYISDLFEDLSADIKPFLQEVKSLFGIFDSKAKPSGQALKYGIEGFFRNVFALATKVVPMVKHFMLDLIIYGLRAYIALKPIAATIGEWAAKAQELGVVSNILTVIKTVFVAVAVAAGVVVTVFAAVVAAAAAIGIAFGSLIGSVLKFVNETMTDLNNWATFAYTAAYDFIAGLVNGITSGASSVVNAVTGLAGKAKNAFKSALGIASPSKEMMKLGAFAGQGVAEGLDSSSSQVGASGAMVGAAAFNGASAGAGGGGNTTNNSTSNNVNVSVQIDGSGKSAQEITDEMVALTFERMALASGL